MKSFLSLILLLLALGIKASTITVSNTVLHTSISWSNVILSLDGFPMISSDNPIFTGTNMNAPSLFGGLPLGTSIRHDWEELPTFIGTNLLKNVTNDLVMGKINTGPPAHFSVSVCVSATATLITPANVTLMYSNSLSGRITVAGACSVPSGILASLTQTNQLTIVDAQANSLYWLTNGTISGVVVPNTSLVSY